jgi:hypothetical protein
MLARRVARLRGLSPAQWRVVVASVLLLPVIQLSLRLRGFGWTARLLADRSTGPQRPYTVQETREAADAVALVAGRRVVGARCLGRSLLLWTLLRRRGIDAEVVIGAQTPQKRALSAHAWVEVAGKPVNDAADVRERFGSFEVALPRLAGPPTTP